MFEKKRILVTGGTGSFGRCFTEYLLTKTDAIEVIIFSRDEFKQSEMAKQFSPEKYPIRYFLGDIRDRDRLLRAFNGVDFVVHAAALKQVPALEYNPSEAVKTNIIGAQNIIDAALDRGVEKVIAISTDKAVSPINLYGATKLAMEKLLIAANGFTRYRDISFSVVRYGNVVGSRGSVIPYFCDLIRSGIRELPITDSRMTRFWITLQQGVNLVIHALQNAKGGEVFIPKIPSMRVVDLVSALPGGCTCKVVGIRPGEKLHESLIGVDEGRTAVDRGDCFIILPQYEFQNKAHEAFGNLPRVPEDFSYRSDNNDQWLDVEKLREMAGALLEGL